MEKLIGNKNLFAIEWAFSNSLTQDFDNSELHYWKYAALRFWIKGKPFGNFDTISSLYCSKNYSQDFILWDEKRIVNQDLYDKSSDQIIETLYLSILNGLPTEVEGKTHGQISTYFHLDNIGESSLIDRFGLLSLVSPNKKHEKIISYEYDTSNTICIEVEYGYVTNLIKSYIDSINQYPY
jgi:hypothetical protein